MAAASSRQETPTQQLAIKDLFEVLSTREKLYAHHLAQAAWNGSRIILRQTSPEGTGIFDFIIELHKACGGQWDSLVELQGVDPHDLTAFLEFAGLFLSGLGNYFGEGDQKLFLRFLAMHFSIWRAALQRLQQHWRKSSSH